MPVTFPKEQKFEHRAELHLKLHTLWKSYIFIESTRIDSYFKLRWK